MDSNLKERVRSLLLKDRTSDVEFAVGEQPEKFRVHRAILASGSSVFETMFFGSILQKSPVIVPDADPRGFDIMIQYLYSDAVPLEDACDAWEAAYVSKKYMVRGLFEACEEYLLKNVALEAENVLSTLEDASFLEMRRLEEQCLRYISRNASKIFLTKSFISASRDVFDQVLSLNLLDIGSESEVIEALWLWGEEQCRSAGLPCSVENVRDRTRDLLRHVRFLAIGVRELTDVLDKCRILDTSDQMALLWNVGMPRTRGAPLDLPGGICKLSETRSISNSGSRIQFPCQYFYDGSMTLFPIENHCLKAEITVTGSPVTVIGAVVAFKPIPCYSHSDRVLDVEIVADNLSSSFKSSVSSCLKAPEDVKDEIQQKLLLDSYVVIEEQQVAWLTINVSGEGVRLMQCAEETQCYDLGKSVVSVKFDKSSNKLFPMKELMIV